MRITFEGKTIDDIVNEMRNMLLSVTEDYPRQPAPTKINSSVSVAPAEAQGPGPDPFVAVDKPVNIPVDTPREKPEKPAKPARAEEQTAAHKNVTEKRIAAAAKMRAAKEAKKQAASAVPASGMPPLPVAPPPASAEGMDPAELAQIRIKTTEELQTAYANGFQQEVFELLARFGNGAKSFREVPVEAFVPIREAIDNGALT